MNNPQHYQNRRSRLGNNAIEADGLGFGCDDSLHGRKRVTLKTVFAQKRYTQIHFPSGGSDANGPLLARAGLVGSIGHQPGKPTGGAARFRALWELTALAETYQWRVLICGTDLREIEIKAIYGFLVGPRYVIKGSNVLTPSCARECVVEAANFIECRKRDGLRLVPRQFEKQELSAGRRRREKDSTT
jgi:hypothetical protein